MGADLPQWASELGICCHACGQQPDGRPFSASLWGCFRSPAYSHVLNHEQCFVRNVCCALCHRNIIGIEVSHATLLRQSKKMVDCVFVRARVHAHCRCPCMEARGQPPMIFLRHHPVCSFVCLRPGLTLGWSSPRRLGWLASELQ